MEKPNLLDIHKQWRLIDHAQVLRMAVGDVEFLAEMIELFQSYVPRQMKDIKQAIEERDSQMLFEAAHAFKGLIVNYTNLDPYHLLLSLEDDAKSGHLDKSLSKFVLLEKEISQLIVELKMLMLQECSNIQSSPEKVSSIQRKFS